MAHTKSGGSTALGRDSVSKRLGVKRGDGMYVRQGMVIVRQRGSKFHPGIKTSQGSDDTIFAMAEGTVHFRSKKVRNYHGKLLLRTFVDVVAAAAQ